MNYEVTVKDVVEFADDSVAVYGGGTGREHKEIAMDVMRELCYEPTPDDVRLEYYKLCTCDGCREGRGNEVHGYDAWWEAADFEAPDAVPFWRLAQ